MPPYIIIKVGGANEVYMMRNQMAEGADVFAIGGDGMIKVVMDGECFCGYEEQ